MPCDNFSETVLLRFDNDERLQTYSLAKQTCGAPVGEPSLLLDLLAGSTPETILTFKISDVLKHKGQLSDTDVFLHSKHLVAIQEAVKVFVGKQAGRPGQACTAVTMAVDGQGLSFEALLAVSALTERIDACCTDLRSSGAPL